MRFGDSSTRVARSWPLLLATLAIAQQAHAQTAAERLMEV
jgi:hypothetical protein